MSSINEPSSVNKPTGIPKEYNEYQIKGRKKTTGKEQKEMARVEEAIKRIHNTVGWDASDNRLSIKRLKETSSRAVFAVSKEKGEDIIGYAVAIPAQGKAYYLSFIAVDAEKQRGGVGLSLLLRIIEKVKKQGGTHLVLDFEDNEKLNKFYSSVPFKKTIEPHGFFRGTIPQKQVTYDLENPEIKKQVRKEDS